MRFVVPVLSGPPPDFVIEVELTSDAIEKHERPVIPSCCLFPRLPLWQSLLRQPLQDGLRVEPMAEVVGMIEPIAGEVQFMFLTRHNLPNLGDIGQSIL